MRTHAKASSAGSTSGQGSYGLLGRGFITRGASFGVDGIGALSVGRGLSGRTARLMAILSVVLASLLFSAARASAVQVFDSQFGAFSFPEDVAVDQASGDVYVIDSGVGNVQKFDADGNPLDFSALGTNVLDGAGVGDPDLTPQGGFSFASPIGSQIAIDSSGGATDGDIYVTDSNNGVVDVFDSTGTYLGQLNGSTTPQGNLATPTGVAVGQGGELYVAAFESTMTSRINLYLPSGSPVTDADYDAQIDVQTDGFNRRAPGQIEVDSAGTVYAVPSPGFGGEALRIDKYPPSLFGQRVISGQEVAPPAYAVAVDPSTDEVYTDEGNRLALFDSSGVLQGRFAPTELTGSRGLAIHAASNRLYASDTADGTVKIFVPPPPLPPLVADQSVASVHSASVDLKATINPRGYRTTYHFEIGTADCSANPCTSIPSSEIPIGAGLDGVDVVQNASGLIPDTTYHIRVVATSTNGTSAGPDLAFRTYPPAGPFQLPDGRVWEKVSPAEKNGVDVVSESLPPIPTADKVRYRTLGSPIPGAGSGRGGSDDVIATRTATGWVSKSLFPSAPSPGSFANPRITSVSEDFSKSVVWHRWPLTPDAPPAPGVFDFNTFLHDHASDSYRLIGNPAAGVNGGFDGAATPDLSQIVGISSSQQTDDPVTGFSNLYEWEDGQRRLVNFLPDPDGPGPLAAVPTPNGAALTRDALARHPFSRDGSRVFFVTPDAFCRTAECGQLYVRQDATETIHISASERTDCAGDPSCGGDNVPDPAPDPNGAKPAVFLGAAAQDGSKVVFATCERLTDDSLAKPNNFGQCLTTGEDGLSLKSSSDDLYLYDLESDELTDLTPTSEARVMGVVGISDDLSRIYFAAGAQLAPGAPPAPDCFVGFAAESGCNLYRWENGTTTFIATLGDGESGLWSFEESRAGGARVTPDGRYLLFLSHARLTAYDNTGPACPAGCPEAYRYDAVSGAIDCVSCSPSGTPPAGPAGLKSSPSGEPLNLLADGTVFFETPDKLQLQDTNGMVDVYRYSDGSARLISDGTAGVNAHFVGATANGSDAFFTTRARLLPSDRDGLIDLYDARVGGGFPEPPPPPACEGDACLPPPVLPNDPTPGSSTYSGQGNQSSRAHRGARKRCAKGRRLRKGKCVRKKASKARAAKTTRRAGK